MRELLPGPTFTITLGSEPLSDKAHRSVSQIRVHYAENGSDSCTIDFNNLGDLDLLNNPSLYEEKPIRVEFGYRAFDSRSFKGIITDIRPEFRDNGVIKVSLTALDADSYPLSKNKRSRTFNTATVSEVMRHIADEYGLDAEIEDTEEVHETIVQREETDMQFLLALADMETKNSLIPKAKEEGEEDYKERTYIVKVKDGTLYFYARKLEGDAKHQLWYNSGDSTIVHFRPMFTRLSHVEELENVGDDLGATDIDEETGEVEGDHKDPIIKVRHYVDKNTWVERNARMGEDGRLYLIDD